MEDDRIKVLEAKIKMLEENEVRREKEKLRRELANLEHILYMDPYHSRFKWPQDRGEVEALRARRDELRVLKSEGKI